MLPTGTVTFLFSDIEGSTRLLQALGDAYAGVLEEHRVVFRAAIAEGGGVEVDSSGDAFFAAFSTAKSAARAAAAIQRGLAEHPWPQGTRVRVRMGLHTGEPNLVAAGYTGIDVHRAARICAAAHGGQILVSETTRELIQHDLPPAAHLRDLGEHRLKDLNRPTRLYQLSLDGLSSDFPPLRTLDARPHNLPVQPTPLIGRTRDIEAVVGLLSRPEVRLVTLTGPGGTGKTRLSLQVAATSIDAFQDGVFFVPLAFTSDTALVPTAIAQALDIRENPAVPLREALRDRLSSKRVLLLIDNFEQVAPAAPFIAELLRIAPSIKILVTSRTVLHLTGEHEYVVPPLDLPTREHTGSAAALSQYAAVELFVQRARAVRPDFAITNENAPAVAEICYRLDGLPLAIELAAARTKLFSPGEMLIRLGKPLDLLRGGPRDAPDRHQTLQRAIAWSYDLLERDEQMLFRRLSIFAGGCRLDAAEAVCGSPSDHVDPVEVVDGIAALVDKSLLRAIEDAPDASRFVMLETIREFGLQRLRESGEEEAVRRAHLEYMARLAEEAEPHLTAPDQAAWLDRLETEHENLRLALTQASRPDEIETARRIGAAVWRFWMVRGHLREGRRQLQRLRTAAAPSDDRRRWIKLLNALGTMTQIGGDFPASSEILQDVLETSLRYQDRPCIASSLNNLSWVLFELGDVNRARKLAEQARPLCAELGDRRGEAAAVTNLAMIAQDQSRYADAIALMDECLKIRRELGEKRGIAYALGMSAPIYIALGDFEEADRRTAEALALATEVRDKQGPAYLHSIRGLMHLERCELDEAASEFDRAMPLWLEMGARFGIGLVTGGRGAIALAQGEPERARSLLLESIGVFRQTQQKRSIGLMLVFLGEADHARGRYDEALAAFTEAIEILEPIGDRRTIAHALLGCAAANDARGMSDAGRADRDRAHILLDQIGVEPTPWQIARGLASGNPA